MTKQCRQALKEQARSLYPHKQSVTATAIRGCKPAVWGLRGWRWCWWNASPEWRCVLMAPGQRWLRRNGSLGPCAINCQLHIHPQSPPCLTKMLQRCLIFYMCVLVSFIRSWTLYSIILCAWNYKSNRDTFTISTKHGITFVHLCLFCRCSWTLYYMKSLDMCIDIAYCLIVYKNFTSWNSKLLVMYSAFSDHNVVNM